MGSTTDEEGCVAAHGLIKLGAAAAVGFEEFPELFQHRQITGDAAAYFMDITCA